MAHKNNMPIHVAAAVGIKSEVISLCKNSELVNAANSLGWSPIMYAAYYGHLDAVKALLSLGADVNAQNDFGGCIYTLAAASGNVEVIRALYSHSRVPSEKLVTPLTTAVVFGHLPIVRFLIDNGADPNSPMENSGVVPLMLAVIENHVEIAKFMVLRGANIVSKNCAGYSALQLAKITGNKTILSFFNEKLGNSIECVPAYATCKNKEAVVKAARNGDLFSLKSLLAHNPSLSTSQHWMTILDRENVSYLEDDESFVTFEDGKNNLKLKQNNTICNNTFPSFAFRNKKLGQSDLFGFCYGSYASSFHYNCYENYQHEVKSRKCASINTEINFLAKSISGSVYSSPVTSQIIGSSPSEDSQKVVNSVIKEVQSNLPFSACELVRTEKKREKKGIVTSPLILACFNGHVEAARLLITAGADPDRQRNGRTPLMVAAIISNMGLVQLLLSSGADPLVESHLDHLTAFELASLSGADTELLRFIASHTMKILFDETHGAESLLYLHLPLKPDFCVSPQRILSKLQALVSPRIQSDIYCQGSECFTDSKKKAKKWQASPMQRFRKTPKIKARRLFSSPLSCISSKSKSNVNNFQQGKCAFSKSQEHIHDICFNYNVTRMPFDSPFESLVSEKISTVMPPADIQSSEINLIEEIKYEISKKNLKKQVQCDRSERTIFGKRLTSLSLTSSFHQDGEVPFLALKLMHHTPETENVSQRHIIPLTPPKMEVNPCCGGNFEEYIEKYELKEYASLFRKNEVADIEIVLSLTGDDLKEMGVLCPEERRKILNKIHVHMM